MKTALGLIFSLQFLAAQSFTLEQVLSAPFPDQLAASPKGDTVAWVQNASGVRNVWVARGQITKFTDDGQEISDLAWKQDGTALYFTRANREIWIAPLSGAAIKLADGSSLAISPDGSLAWIQDGQVWSMRSGRQGPLIQVRGTAKGLRWSPDGGRLAFISGRGDHAFIAVYDLHDKSLRFLDPSVDMDESPVWSPDGKQIVFIRRPAANGEFEFSPRRNGPPWSIRVADAQSGKGREIWRAQEGRGSVFWAMRVPDQLIWMAGDQLVFPWERDGWLHLYALKNGAARPLTPGEFEIENVAPAPDRKAVVFSSNQDDPDRRHLWRVALDNGTPQRITTGTGIEWSPSLLSDGRIALLHSDAKTPARAAMLEGPGTFHDLAPFTFPSASLVEPQPIIIPGTDGLKLDGQLFLPPNDASGKHPAVVFFHGGSRRQMLLGWHYMFYYNQTYGLNQYLASKGYVVLSINFRSGIGYGTDFREWPNFGATGASDFNDVLAAGNYLRSRADVDPARIGAWGGSYGGYLTAMALARASDVFAVGVDLAGVHDWNLEVTRTAPARDAEKRKAIERIAFESSPMASIATWRSPVLLIQGDDDHDVAFAQSVQLVEALRKQGVPFEQLIFPDEAHDFLLHSNWLKAFHAADEFLARYLKP